MTTNFKVTIAKENISQPSGSFGMCARHGIMPVQNKGKSGALAVRNVTAPVRAKVVGKTLVSTTVTSQRTVLKEIHNKALDSKVGTLCKEVTNISIRPKQDNAQRLVKDKLLKPLQGKTTKPVQEKIKPFVDKTQDSVLEGERRRRKEAAKSAAVEPQGSLEERPVPTTKGVSLVEPEQPSYSTLLLPTAVEDIDRSDEGNLILVSNYIDDIYKYLRELEVKYPVKRDHLNGSIITPRMRSILVNWLIDVHGEFRLLAETLYLTVTIIDRFLQKDKTINQKNLQLVGCTAMFVAAKYEEMMPPEVSDYVFISSHVFTKQDVMSMEFSMLDALEFALGRPSPVHFLRRFSKAAQATTEVHTLAKYALELCLLEYSMSHVPPSLCAAAALYTARYAMSVNGFKAMWTSTLQHYTQYSEAEVLPVARTVAAIVFSAKTSKYKSVHSKYASSKFGKASMDANLDRLKSLASL